MPKIKIARPKALTIYTYGYGRVYDCHVYCYPQQKWKCKVDNNKVEIRRKGIAIEISEKDFKKNWKEVE